MHNYLEKNMVAGMVGRNMESKTHPKKAENIFAHKIKKALQVEKLLNKPNQICFKYFSGIPYNVLFTMLLCFIVAIDYGEVMVMGLFFSAKT